MSDHIARTLGQLRRLHTWSHRGPVRSLVMKIGATIAGVVVIVAGIAMLVLPGPGLVVMGIGVGVLATEWPWALKVLHVARVQGAAVRRVLFPHDASRLRRAAGTVVVAAFFALGFAATSATTYAVGAIAVA
ncbi:PGPGW domain-containing protein [Nocardioides sp. CN2-186]|uniref:PGPGW domain-containing protein n=1 Tax=Nocardioides tweenelious TaxID=3156607 RepID=UPI0032B49DE6